MERGLLKDEKSQLQIYIIAEMLILTETGGNKGKHVVWSEMLTVRKKGAWGIRRSGWRNLRL